MVREKRKVVYRKLDNPSHRILVPIRGTPRSRIPFSAPKFFSLERRVKYNHLLQRKYTKMLWKNV
jgi:hypothetical protein